MKKIAPWFISLALFGFSLAVFAQDNDALPRNAARGFKIEHANNLGKLGTKGNIPTPHGFPQGVDTIVNFTNQFQAPGVYFDGTAHNIWEYSMVGNPPNKGGTTVFN